MENIIVASPFNIVRIGNYSTPPKLSEYPQFETLTEKIDKLQELPLVELKILYQELMEFSREISLDRRHFEIYGMNPPLYGNMISVDERIVELECPKFCVKTKVNTVINGREVKTDKEYLSYDLYKEFEKIFNDDEKMTKEEFTAAMKETCCTDWYKMDTYGECYTGHWKTDSSTAWDKTFQDNVDFLYALPYPPKAILKTIEIGCNSRLESCPYSLAVCQWIVEKKKQIETKEEPKEETKNEKKRRRKKRK